MLNNDLDLVNEQYFSLSSDSSDSESNSFHSIPSLSDALDSQFSDVSKNFNVVHINAQSIPAHYSDLLTSFDVNNLHAVLVSESWLKPCLPSISFSLPGFRLIRNDRIGSAGGVAIYLRSHIPFSIISSSPQPPATDAGEHLFIEVILSHTKILLGVYYSPSLRINYFSSFELILEKLIPNYDHTILMGDFNTCLLKLDHRTSRLQSITTSCNLHILPLNSTHHFPNCTPSLLDLVIVSSLQHVAKHGQYPADAFSYHDLIYLSYKIRPPKDKPKIILQRNFGAMNRDAFLNDAINTNWLPVVNAENVDDQVAIFNSIITQLYDKHAPLRPIKLKHLPAPWLTENIRLLMRKKITAKFKFKTQPSDTNKNKYTKARNRCNTVCRNALRRHIHVSVENEDDPGKVWQFLRSFGIGKSRQDSIPRDLNLNSLNIHFSSASNINDSIKTATLHNFSSLPIPDHSPFVFSQLSDCDVKRSILSITSNAVGNDGISRNMIVPILDIILPVLCVLLNNSISSSTFPAIWKEALIIPLPKKSNPQTFSDYRPISILPFLSKVLERIVHNQISKFLTYHDLLNPYQSGFRPGHSTTTALLKITDDIRSGMDNSQLTVLTLLDFSNAFNTVDFDILLAFLRSLNISPTVIDWFHSYLLGRRQRIRLNEEFSSWCNTTAGVPQGGVLSPLLFSIFINSITQKLTSSYHLYADDLQIYTHATSDELTNVIINTNIDLDHIATWSNAHGLRVNPIKTQTIVVGSSRLLSKLDWQALPKIKFNGIAIPFSESVKNLGLTMDRCFSWNQQLQTTSRKLYASAASLRRLQYFLPIATKIALVQTLLFPILDYADICYLDLTEEQLNKLERLQNFCIRFIFGLRKYDHISEYRQKLKWLPIRLRRNTHILSLLYKILFNPKSPRYLTERFKYLRDANSFNLRSSENLMLQTPVHRGTFFKKSFTVQAVYLWNSLPLKIRQAKTLDTFKMQIRNFYLNFESINIT